MPSQQVERYNAKQAAIREKLELNRKAGLKLQAKAAADEKARIEAEAKAEFDRQVELDRIAAETPRETPVGAEVSEVQEVLDQALAEGILEAPIVADPSVTSARIEEQDGERVLVEVVAGVDTDVVSEPEAVATVVTEVLKARKRSKSAKA